MSTYQHTKKDKQGELKDADIRANQFRANEVRANEVRANQVKAIMGGHLSKGKQE